MTNPQSSINLDSRPFSRTEATHCACCAQPLGTGLGFAVPYIGVVGPKCVQKFAALAGALAQMDGLTVPAGTAALGRLRLNLVGLGYEAQITTLDDGRWTLKIGARTRTDADKVCVTWEERRGEFVRDLQAASAQPTPVVAPALTEAALTALSPAERRMVATEYGVRTASGKPSTSVALIWAAVQAARVAEAQVAAPVLALTNPAFDEPFVLPYHVGPFEQPQQRHFAQEAVGTKLRMGRKVLLPLREAAEKARAVDGDVMGFLNVAEDRIVGYRVYTGRGRRSPSAMQDCEPGWGVRYQGCYTKGTWFAGRTAEDQPLIPDPLRAPQHHQEPEQQAGAVEAAYPEVGYQQLAEGLRKLAAGRHEQEEQQQAQQRLAVAPRFHAPLPERLHRLALELKAHEVNAEAGSDARTLRGLRADHVAGLAWAAQQGERHEQVQQRQMTRADGVTDAALRVLGEIKVERGRQQAQEGWDPAHDDAHLNGELADAAAAYALTGGGRSRSMVVPIWPWALAWLKPTSRRRDLVKAGALIVAEIERLDRATQDGPHAQEEQQQGQRAPVDVQESWSVAWSAYVAACEEEERLYALPDRPGWEAARRARTETFNAWVVAQEGWLASMDGPHAQPEQQQAQAVAVALAAFEPECDRCGALLDTSGNCPVCAPRWRPCETGVRHAQTIPATREQAYCEHEKAHRAAHRARKAGAESARQRRLDEASQDAWTAYRRWVDADSFAAQAGAYDHLVWRDY